MTEWKEHTKPGATIRSWNAPQGDAWMIVAGPHPDFPAYPYVYGICEDPPGTGAFIISGRCSSELEAKGACQFAKKL